MKKVLFVCSGNTCRSPLAEGIARKLFSDSKRCTDRISSAGCSALDGLPASALAVEVAKAHSIDISGHQARLLSRTLVKDADLIVTMGSNHGETVGIIEPAALGHTHLLTDFCDDAEGDVPDPIGQDRDAYERTFMLIENCVASLLYKLDAFDGWKKTESGG